MKRPYIVHPPPSEGRNHPERPAGPAVDSPGRSRAAWVEGAIRHSSVVFNGSPAGATESTAAPEIQLVVRHAVPFQQAPVLLLEAEPPAALLLMGDVELDDLWVGRADRNRSVTAGNVIGSNGAEGGCSDFSVFFQSPLQGSLERMQLNIFAGGVHQGSLRFALGCPRPAPAGRLEQSLPFGTISGVPR